MNSRSIFFAPIFAGLAGLAGCTGSLLDSEAPAAEIYVLAPAPAANNSTGGGTLDVVVAEPSAAPGLLTERIAVLHPDRRLEYYARARWGSTAARVMQSVVVGSLQNQFTFRSVTAAPAGTAANYIIDFELRDFQAEYAGKDAIPQVRVTVVANVIRVADRRLVKVVPANATVRATENRLAAVIAAFESAAQQVATTIGRDTASALAADAGGAR